MIILFLHGWTSKPGGVKPTYLASQGHTVLNPALPDEDFVESGRVAQREYDRDTPEVVVGSSRGGAVAMNIASGETPLVLLCPAWKQWGSVVAIRRNAVILHSRGDDVIPYADSEELIRNSGLPATALITVGTDHRLADEGPLKAMLVACERWLPSGQFKLPCCGDTPVRRLRELLHLYGTDFDLFRCDRCQKPWVGYRCDAGPGGGWREVTGAECVSMMQLPSTELFSFMRVWAEPFH